MGWLKVKDNDGLVRDTETNAIINTNTTEYQNYMARKQRISANESQIEFHGQEIDSIKKDINEIKQMLTALLNKTV
jgi:hypothetical protein